METGPKRSTTSAVQETRDDRLRTRSMLFTGILLGIGIVGFLDETIFHQILQWHTFYWATTQYGRILSDGLFHIFSTLLLLWGTFRLWRSRPTWNVQSRGVVFAGIFLGGGGFNLYDGVIQHLTLKLHIVNELVCSTPASRADTILGVCKNDFPYEIAWIVAALILLTIGSILWRRRTRSI